jgi:hypothetical protein
MLSLLARQAASAALMNAALDSAELLLSSLLLLSLLLLPQPAPTTAIARTPNNAAISRLLKLISLLDGVDWGSAQPTHV